MQWTFISYSNHERISCYVVSKFSCSIFWNSISSWNFCSLPRVPLSSFSGKAYNIGSFVEDKLFSILLVCVIIVRNVCCDSQSGFSVLMSLKLSYHFEIACVFVRVRLETAWQIFYIVCASRDLFHLRSPERCCIRSCRGVWHCHFSLTDLGCSRAVCLQFGYWMAQIGYHVEPHPFMKVFMFRSQRIA